MTRTHTHTQPPPPITAGLGEFWGRGRGRGGSSVFAAELSSVSPTVLTFVFEENKKKTLK